MLGIEYNEASRQGDSKVFDVSKLKDVMYLLGMIGTQNYILEHDLDPQDDDSVAQALMAGVTKFDPDMKPTEEELDAAVRDYREAAQFFTEAYA